MPRDHFDVVTALDSARDEAVKKQAGVRVAEKAANEKKSDKPDTSAIDELEKQMSELHSQGRALMAKGQHNTPEYDALVVKNKHLRRKRDFMLGDN